MGKIKYLMEIENFIRKTPVFDIASLKKFISEKKGNKEYIYQLINKMLKKGKIKRLTKGFYTIYDDPSFVVFCFKPAYLGLQDAMSFHNLWEQETIPIIITTRNVRPGTRTILGTNVLIRKINKKYFYGFGYYKQGDFYFPCSDIEKTMIDLIYFKTKITREEMKKITKKTDKDKLKGYLKNYPIKFRKKVMKILSF